MSDDKSPDLLEYFKYFEGKMAISGTTSLVTISSVPFVNDAIETVLVLLFIASVSCFLAGLLSKILEWRKRTSLKSEIKRLEADLKQIEARAKSELKSKEDELAKLKSDRKRAKTFLDGKFLDKKIEALKLEIELLKK